VDRRGRAVVRRRLGGGSRRQFTGSARAEESPATIPKRRYARGEIDREEFDRRLTDLRK
jgi:uncharacterized membrane protein